MVLDIVYKMSHLFVTDNLLSILIDDSDKNKV